MPQQPVTERQILDAMEEHSEAWVEQLVRRAKNQRLALSDACICAVGDYLQMPDLMDRVVEVRVAERGPYSLAELNPPVGTPSVCEVVTPAKVRGLLALAGGRLTADDAYRFCDYHLTDADDALLEQVVRMSDLSRWDAEAILDDLGYAGDKDRLLARGGGRGSAGPRPAPDKGRRKASVLRRTALGALGALAVVVGIALGGVLVGAVVLVVIVLALVAGSSAGADRAERYPDVRSDYGRRVWADDHNFEADGDADHNFDADGDRPW